MQRELQLDLSRYNNIIVLTGAGVSVASGLPTYRGTGGVWEVDDVQQYATARALQEDPERVWRYFDQARRQALSATPNPTHLALALAESSRAPDQQLTIITQNIDGLHQRAGSSNVIELHGSLEKTRCVSCDFSRKEPPPEPPLEPAGACPRCPSCGQHLRPDVTLFDEHLPALAEWESKRRLRDCDLFLAVGTSGTVSPASNFVRSAAYAGARTIYINVAPMNPHNPAFSDTLTGRSEELIPQIFSPA